MKIVQSEIEGIGFSIPIEDALQYANKIVKGEKIERPFLGIQMADVSTSSYYLSRQGIKIDSSITSGVIVSLQLETTMALQVVPHPLVPTVAFGWLALV